MTDTIYQLWQSGKDAKTIAKELKRPILAIQTYINNTPKERHCKRCGNIYKVKQRSLYCSRLCQIRDKHNVTNEYKKITKHRKKHVEPLHIVNEKAREMGLTYGEYVRRARHDD